MNPLKQIAKILRKHHARLIIETHSEANEIVLSIPAHIATTGDIFAYATEYRLGKEFPQYPPQTPLLDAEFEEIKI